MSKVRIAIVGVGNCASSLVQGLTYYRDADPSEKVPGLMHVELGGYHVGDVEVVAAFDVDAKVGRDVAEAIFSSNNTIRFADDVPRRGRRESRSRWTAWGLLPGRDHRVGRAGGRRRRRPARRGGGRARLVPAGRVRGGREVLRAVRDRRGRGLRELPPAFIASDPEWAEVRRGGRSDRRRRHQVAGRRDDHASDAREAVRGPRSRARPHVPAELRRQHGLHEHARAEPADLEEDLEDAVGPVAVGRSAREGPDPHRPVGPRAVSRTASGR